MAKCNRKTLRGIFGAGRKLGLDKEDLRAMTDSGHLSQIDESEAARILQTLRDQQADNRGKNKIWRLYSSSTLAREINWYASMITWREPGGFRAWLKKYFGIERLEWVDSFKLAISIKNALKRMYNEQQRKEACVE